MNFEKLFLKEDFVIAKRMLKKIGDKLACVPLLIEDNDLEQARSCLNHALIEVDNLVELKKEKRCKEQLERIAEELTGIGIDPIEVLRTKYETKQN